MLKGGIPQTYENYYGKYFNSPEGRAAKNKATRKYRRKLAKVYRISEARAAKRHPLFNRKPGEI